MLPSCLLLLLRAQPFAPLPDFGEGRQLSQHGQLQHQHFGEQIYCHVSSRGVRFYIRSCPLDHVRVHRRVHRRLHRHCGLHHLHAVKEALRPPPPPPLERAPPLQQHHRPLLRRPDGQPGGRGGQQQDRLEEWRV